MSKEYRIGRILCWYDRSLRLWTITECDKYGDQIGEATYAASKDEAMVIAHQMFAEQGSRSSSVEEADVPGLRDLFRGF